jgi:hypothetical protein
VCIAGIGFYNLYKRFFKIKRIPQNKIRDIAVFEKERNYPLLREDRKEKPFVFF